MATEQESDDEGKKDTDRFRRSLAQWLQENITADVAAAGQEGYDEGDNPRS
jgi:hypothetical protein